MILSRRSNERRERGLKVILLLALTCLAGCSWWGGRKPPAPDPTELVVTGAPPGSTLVVDGVRVGSAPTEDTHPQVVRVRPGEHQVEIHVGDPVVYREDTYVGRGEQRVVKVLSGSYR